MGNNTNWKKPKFPNPHSSCIFRHGKLIFNLLDNNFNSSSTDNLHNSYMKKSLALCWLNLWHLNLHLKFRKRSFELYAGRAANESNWAEHLTSSRAKPRQAFDNPSSSSSVILIEIACSWACQAKLESCSGTFDYLVNWSPTSFYRTQQK